MVRLQTTPSASAGPRKHCRYCGTKACLFKKTGEAHDASCAKLCPACVAHALIAARYGLTLRNYMYLYFEVFGSRCGICPRRSSYRSRKQQTVRLSIDQQHEENEDDERTRLAAQRGVIRGILCNRCNHEVDLTDLLEEREAYIDEMGQSHYDKVT